ncbi:uncharacterized protein PITG_07553 [Phytophthora infestans T30-4]|uniref:Uncharacterized protein n=1 Tax=Phytophthora infestans (strain T30-4) TaxID=403677 RepID=D0N8M3_PHYIT|nr:uncharacterized protein PITG_07553 [Phytophthora infestans T30-4]EEY53908.1 conserved hypothetical protein [Phytophthora infestans T30-4]|eukprot:XP_002904539.1 conserved hypothetical protein [Phytophthora infestans T30-4]
MKADEAVDDEVIYLHKKDGFHKKRGYSIFVYLSMAMTVVNVLAKQIDKYEWQQCQCTKCAYYRSPEWRQTRPDDITPAMLPPMRFYRRGSKGVSPSEKIYRKQREQKKAVAARAQNLQDFLRVADVIKAFELIV